MSPAEDTMVAMQVAQLSVDALTGMPLLVLREIEGEAAITIWIGLVEASAIAAQLQNVCMQRPMTHDLMKTLVEQGRLRVACVEIRDLREGTFFAAIVLDREGERVEVDARPSDAVALALRTGAPIYVARKLIDKTKLLTHLADHALGRGLGMRGWPVAARRTCSGFLPTKISASGRCRSRERVRDGKMAGALRGLAAARRLYGDHFLSFFADWFEFAQMVVHAARQGAARHRVHWPGPAHDAGLGALPLGAGPRLAARGGRGDGFRRPRRVASELCPGTQRQ